MSARTTMAAAMVTAMMAMTATLFAAEQPKPQAWPSEPIYGYRMMSDDERNDYRERMRNARGNEERQAIRDEHHKLMQERAKERGVTLPERGPGPGAGPGSGPHGPGGGPREGMGPRAGMGPGGGGGSGPRAEVKGPGHGGGPRGECPAGQDCPAPGSGKGPGPRTK